MMSSPFTILLAFIILVFLGIPIAYSMIITSIFFILSSGRGIEDVMIPFSRLGLGISFSLLAIFFFIQLGYLMNETKISDYLIDFVRKLISRFIKHGATGAITILSSAGCGPLTGSAVGTTTAVGGIMIPQMNKVGYDPKYSTALLAYSGILGSLIPPSISGLIYAVVVNLSVFSVWMATLGVGILYLIILLSQHLWIAKRRNYDSSYDIKESKGDLYKSFIKALPSVIVAVSVLGSIYGGIATPTEAGVVGIFFTLLLGIFYYKTINSFKQFIKVIYTSAYQSALVMFLLCGSFALSYCLTVTGSVKAIARIMLLLTDNKNLLLLLTQGLILVLGCFLDTTPIIILLAPVVSAILIPIGVHPYQLAAIFSFVALVGLVTPPVGSVLYVSAAISGENIGNMVKEIIIFFIPVVIVMLLITFVPEISLIIPKLLGLI